MGHPHGQGGHSRGAAGGAGGAAGGGPGAPGGRPDPAALFGMDPLVMLERSFAVAQHVVDAVPGDRFGDQSPCEAWTVRDAVNHLVAGNRWAAQALRDGGQPGPRLQGDLTGDDPARAFAESAAEVMAALREPGALGTMMRLPFGTMPGVAFAGVRAIDVLSHAWDIARGTGQPTATLDPELYAAALAASRKTMTFDREGSPFRPETPISPTAAPADQLAAFMGRTAEWLPAAEPAGATMLDHDDFDAPPSLDRLDGE